MATYIGRRKFIAALAGGLAISRSIAEAEPVAKVYRVGFLLGATGESVASLFHALKEGLRELGYVEGRNIAFVQRYADGRWSDCRILLPSWCGSRWT
jgi:putative ABC transport system substrate-binding protein